MKQKRKLAKERKKRKRDAAQAAYRNRRRRCGKCRMCCWLFPLIEKPARSWCCHSKPDGCDCYKRRPQVCREYRCLYLVDHTLPDTWRPDRSGIIITRRFYFREHIVVVLSECWDGAIHGLIGRDILQAFHSSDYIFFVDRSDGVATVRWSHTGVVLDADGREELFAMLDDDVDKAMAQIESQPFAFAPLAHDDLHD
jgi:hypothetical protein